MRSTKAANAIERLKRRSDNPGYAMGMSGKGHFYLLLSKGDGESERLCEPMELDDFVTFVNAYGPQTPVKLSKLDVEFGKQLDRSKHAHKKSPSEQ